MTRGAEAVDATAGAPARNLRYAPWLSYDDDVVREVQAPQGVVTYAAYYLCYVRRDCVGQLGW